MVNRFPSFLRPVREENASSGKIRLEPSSDRIGFYKGPIDE
jgi:hypothetical protein